MASFASALQEQCLYGIDDDAFANFPAHSIYPPPFATDAPAGPFAAWAAQVHDTRMRQRDSSKRIFDHAARVPMPPLKSYQVLYIRHLLAPCAACHACLSIYLYVAGVSTEH